MNKTFKGFLIGVVVTVLWFVFYTNIPWGPPVKTSDDLLTLRKLKSAMRVVRSSFDGEVDEQKISDYLFLGLAAGLDDKYAAYYTKDEYEKISNSQQGYFTGIGIEFMVDSETGAVIITAVSEEGPAQKAGVLPEDEIVSIEEVPVEGMTSSEVAALVQGSENDTIMMTVYRPSEEKTFDFSIKKENIETRSVYGAMSEDGIGMIKITSFTGVTDKQFSDILGKMREEGVKGLIIDLRDNGGGLVTGVCDTLKNILPKGDIVSIVNKFGDKSVRTCDGENELELPLAVLVNENTASASEIFAGAVQDHGKGVIIGVQTYGKGIVQDSFRLSDGSVLKLTVSHYYTPNGNDIHEKGITPDIVVENSGDQEMDEQLDAAVEYLENEIKEVTK